MDIISQSMENESVYHLEEDCLTLCNNFHFSLGAISKEAVAIGFYNQIECVVSLVLVTGSYLYVQGKGG